MKIKTEEQGWSVYEGTTWTAIDEDTYDGAPDSHSPIGWGVTEAKAVEDLCEQIVEGLENQIDSLRFENRCIRNENQALLTRCLQIPPETLRPDDGQHASGESSAILTLGNDCEVTTGLQCDFPPSSEDLEDRCMGRSPDDEYHPSDYNGPRPNWEERQGQE